MKKLMVFIVFALLVFSLSALAIAESNESGVSNGVDADVNDSSDDVVELEIEENVTEVADEQKIPDGTITSVRPGPNAAVSFCEKKGYKAETRTDSTGKEYPVCVFPDGKECNQFEFLREKCGREYLKGVPQLSSGDLKKRVMDRIRAGDCSEDCSIDVEDEDVTIRDLSAERREIIANKINARTGLNLSAEDIDGKTMLRAYLSNGRWALIKHMPDSASEKALENMNAKCAENGCSVELKEVGVGNKTRLAYVVKMEKESRVFLIFKKNMVLSAEVDAETGDVISVKRPWWSFLAKEKNERSEDENPEVVLESDVPSNLSA